MLFSCQKPQLNDRSSQALIRGAAFFIPILPLARRITSRAALNTRTGSIKRNSAERT
nr:MAG TPA: hypothetical protein [Caudoviricetes sp.]